LHTENDFYGFAGFEEMAKMLYPAKFNDLDPDKDIQEFFSKYMEMSYSGIQWTEWDKQ
jgi:iron complex transport system substrate-binding protein